MDVTNDGLVVRKAATTIEEHRRLAREAIALRTLAHPGVVRLVGTEGGDPPTALLLERPAGAVPWSRDCSEGSVRQIGAAVATTLADLHDLGWAHTAVRPDHVLIGEGQRPVLCGFGSAVRTRTGSVEQRRDVADLANMIVQLLPNSGDRSWRRRLEGARHSRRCDARWLARVLREDHQAPTQLLWVAGAAIFGITAAVSLYAVTARRPAAPCPAVDVGCRSRPGLAGPDRLVFTDPAQIVLGRWQCTPKAYPAVLDLRTGAVWMFSAWPTPGRTTTPALVTQASGARSLSVQPAASGCDRLVVRR